MNKDVKKKEGSEQNSKVNSEAKSEEKNKRKLKPLHWVIIALVVLALGATITYFMWLEEDEPVVIEDRGTALGGRGMILTPDNIEEVTRLMNEPNPDAQFTVSMTTNWEFETSQTPSRTALVNNREHNSRTVYFDVILIDTGEVVYSSPYIPLGGTLENFALDANLHAGVYNAIIRFFLVDDDNEVVAEVEDTVTLTING